MAAYAALGIETVALSGPGADCADWVRELGDKVVPRLAELYVYLSTRDHDDLETVVITHRRGLRSPQGVHRVPAGFREARQAPSLP